VNAHPATLTLSETRLKTLSPELYVARSWTKFLRENGYRLGSQNEDPAYWREYIADYLRTGDPRAAVVVSASPLLVAAYAAELDCVALLRFDKKIARHYRLAAGDRLLAVNTYLEWNFWSPEDLTPGPRASGKYKNVAPLIGDFLSDDEEQLTHLKTGVGPSEWTQAETLGVQYLNQFGERARDGRPLLCHLPAKK
jgi:hypothetical protein